MRFSTPSNFTVGDRPYSLDVADFNGDTIPDIVVANYGGNNLSILLGDGAGGFTLAANSPSVGTLGAVSVFTGDFDNDGDLDIATANVNLGTFASNVSILLSNNGDGTFATNTYAVPQAGLVAIAVGDYNNDGLPDIAAGSLVPGNNNVSVFLATDIGIYNPTPFTYTIGQTTRSLDLGDLKGDGLTDLALVRSGQSQVFVRLGTGTGGSGEPVFSATETSFTVGTEPRSVKIVDIDGDGKQDLVVANSGSDNVSVLLGNGKGSFATAKNYAVGDGSRAVAVADLDGNGSLDIIVANENADTLSVLWSPTGSVGSDIIRGGDGNDTLDGGANDTGNDTLNGGAGDDVIRGRNGNDSLVGGAGNDTLNGGITGTDTLVGGTGDDTYIINELGEVIVENVGEGNDRVRSSITYTLSANLENLVLTGTADISGTSSDLDGFILGNSGNNNLNGGAGRNTLRGNDGDDAIRGNGGDDILIGGLGNDTLRGGIGNDIFRFNATGQGIDSIMDFVAADDTIEISAAGFGGGLSAGALADSAFVSGAGITTAGDLAHRFIYNTSNGALFFDDDGIAGGSIQIATLSGMPTITAADIVII